MQALSPCRKRLVDVLCGGPGREHAISRLSAAAVSQALQEQGHDVAEICVQDSLDRQSLRPGSLVFNLIHGTYGEDGSLQAALDAWGWPYVGSQAAASRLCMDKAQMRACAQAAGVAVAWGLALEAKEAVSIADIPPSIQQWVLKPRCDGSSVGLRFIDRISDLAQERAALEAELGAIPLLLEERLAGPEFSVAVLEDAAGQAQALPPIAIIPATGVYDFSAKYQRDDTQYRQLTDPDLVQTLQRAALQCYQAAGCRHFARVDFMADQQGRPHMLEINTLPGFTSHSLVPMAASWLGMNFAQLCQHLLALAEKSEKAVTTQAHRA